MIHIKKEGHYLKRGLSLYSLFDRGNFGGVFRRGNDCWWFRYNKTNKKWIIGKTKLVPAEIRGL